MEKLPLIKKILTGLVLVVIIILFSPKKDIRAQSVLFQDSFDDNDASDWNVVKNTCWYNGLVAKWEIHDGKYGVLINGGNCRTETVPTLFSPPAIFFNHFRYELDMTFSNSVSMDRNFIFRYVDQNNWYGIHTVDNRVYIHKVINGNDLSFYSATQTYPFVKDQTYRFKIEVDNLNISVFINDVPLVTVVDSAPLLSGGTLGLQASAGYGYTSSEVWFDNVVVTSLAEETGTPTPTPTLTPTPTSTPTPTATLTPTNTPTPTPISSPPVVFLPGLGASFNFKEMLLGVSDPSGWRMTPGANVYDNILKAFADYPNFYVFYYDWRKPVMESAQKLNDFIKNEINLGNKVYLIGHSLGGLVSRTCVQKTSNNCYADKLITVGSPHAGAVDSYPALEGGEVWRTGPVKLLYELFIHYNQIPGETRRETIERIAPVLKDLLPTFDYLTKNGVNLPPSALSFQNLLLPTLSDLSFLENKTSTLIGRGFNSVEQIILTDRNWVDKLLGNWPDGKPIGKILTLEGDTSVLTKSSSFDNPNIENFTYSLDHAGIISEQAPLSKIMELLSMELPAGTYSTLNDEENFLLFFVHSPVKISSPDVSSDSYANDELIIIPHPQNQNYSLNVEGLENGFYKLTVGQVYGEQAFFNDYFGQTYPGKNELYTFAVNPQNPSLQPLIDPAGTTTQKIVKASVEEIKFEVQNLPGLTDDQRNLLLIPLVLIIPDKAEGSLLSLGGFRNLVATYEKGKLVSNESANLLRSKSTILAGQLEYLAFLSPKTTKKKVSDNSIKLAQKAKNAVKINKLNKNAVPVYQEADEKLTKALQNSSTKDYFRAKVFANEATSLFTEAKLLAK